MTYPLLFLLGNEIVSLSVQSDGRVIVSLKNGGQIQGTFNQYVQHDTYNSKRPTPLKLEDLIEAKR